jgi:hypothetical protein
MYREGASLLNSSSPLHLPIEKEPQIPRSILSIPGVAALLFEENTMGMGDGLSEGASAAIISAQHFQAKASDPRLTNKPSTARGADGGLNKFKNLGKANQVVAERKSKREEANLIGIGNGIKVSATLWSMEEGHGKMLQVSDVCLFRNPLSMDLFNVFLACGCPRLRVTQVFNLEKKTQEALDLLLRSVQQTFSSRHADANPLTWYVIIYV